VQSFLNFTAQRTDGQVYSRLGQDLGIMHRNVLGEQRDSLDVNGTVDARTLLAIGVYSWRMANRGTAPGEWARSIPRVTLPTTAPAQPSRTEEGEQRRRVLHY
jgi:hypothetical protein